jgi:iron(III) transport system substrate-binding protein
MPSGPRLLLLCLTLLLSGCRYTARSAQRPAPEQSDPAGEVVVYVSLDRPYAEPVLRAFEQETGVRARVVYDTEAAKSLGLARRIVAERRRPRADVFWSSEVVRLMRLKEDGVLAPYRARSAAGIPARFRDADGYWTGFAARARVLVWNLKQVREPPRSLLELTEPKWRGAVVMANPLFGTTASEAAALFQVLGTARAQAFYRALRENGVRIVDGNAVVADRVARGQAKVGLTDTDDAYSRIRDGKPLGMRFLDQERIGALLIPNMVALVQGGPHPTAGKRLIEFLLRPETEALLARGEARQIPLRPDVRVPTGQLTLAQVRAMAVSYERLPGEIDAVDRFLRDTFLR